MTVQNYMDQLEKIRGIAHQDISMFEYTPIRNVCNVRKNAAQRLDEDMYVNEETRESLLEIIDRCEITIKNYLLL